MRWPYVGYLALLTFSSPSHVLAVMTPLKQRVFGAPNLFITFTCNGGGDAMAICRVFGAPDLFITFTCNSGDDTTKTKSTVSPTDATGVLPHPSPTETKNITTKMRSHASNSCKATKKLFPVESTEDAERDSHNQ